MFVFASDLRYEGIPGVRENVRARARVLGITVAVAYHWGRDIFPHNPVSKVRYLEGDSVCFRPETSRYRALNPTAKSKQNGGGVGCPGALDTWRG